MSIWRKKNNKKPKKKTTKPLNLKDHEFLIYFDLNYCSFESLK